MVWGKHRGQPSRHLDRGLSLGMMADQEARLLKKKAQQTATIVLCKGVLSSNSRYRDMMNTFLSYVALSRTPSVFCFYCQIYLDVNIDSRWCNIGFKVKSAGTMSLRCSANIWLWHTCRYLHLCIVWSPDFNWCMWWHACADTSDSANSKWISNTRESETDAALRGLRSFWTLERLWNFWKSTGPDRLWW